MTLSLRRGALWGPLGVNVWSSCRHVNVEMATWRVVVAAGDWGPGRAGCGLWFLLRKSRDLGQVC